MKKTKYNQVVVWPGTLVGGKSKQVEFVNFMLKELDVRVVYIEEIKTFPDKIDGVCQENTGGRNDVFFYVHDDDIKKFVIPRFQYGMRWFEDVLDNDHEREQMRYPERVREYRAW